MAEFHRTEGQFLLPMVELIEQAQRAVDEVISVAGRAALDAALKLSAQELAGHYRAADQILHRGEGKSPV